MKNEQQLAEQILHAVGGIENINDILHCMTRIRLKLNNKQHVNYTELKSIKGVLGVIDDDRLQIVLGPGVVDKVTEYIEKQHKTTSSPAQPTENKQHKNSNKRWNKVLRTIADIFIPLIPAFVGAGLIGGIAAVLNNFIQAGDLTADWVKQMVVVLNVIKDGMFFYLAIYTGINAAKVFGATPGLGGVIGGTTLLTGISDKNPIVNIFTGEPLLPSQGGIIGVIIAVWLLSLIEKRLHKIVPNAIDIIITPTLTLLIIGLLTIFVIMPLAGFISSGLVIVVNWVIDIGGIFSGFIIGASFLPLVMLGLHHIFTPIHIELINQTGATNLLPIAAMAGAGQVGAALALWMRCKRNKQLTNVIKGALPAGFLGIGEPLIYGVTLPLGRPFFTACLGGGIGGAVIGGIGHIGARAIGPSGLSLFPLISNHMYLGYLIGLISAYIGGFILTYFFGTTKSMRNSTQLGG
ncbi:PTS transporter subunit EIIC [Staphylococcus lugdunensis]|uniref:PTS transporter subunit EIIC n=1 Tax=Staphylococcus lugdunensis TaxID=28035 RepID=UPI0002F3AA3F|nr:PTS transporter subunit EIIC [Staphylococcus lugdunensis]SQE71096.1 PTS system IIB component/PTS system IIC component [Staphylococcus lugdunensis]